MTMPRVLIIDLYNMLHRARGGFTLGPAPVTFNFFRSLRAIVGQMKPTRIIMADEGEPIARMKMLPTYKSNRIIPAEDLVKQEEMRRFRVQKDECIDYLRRYFPVSVVRHPDYEADDTIYTMIRRGSSAVETVVISTDGDFTQLLNEFDHVKLYNPIKKCYVEKPAWCYVTWKALRGDPSDNIEAALKGSQRHKDDEANDIVDDPDKLLKIFSDPETAATFARNMMLIKFDEIPEEEFDRFESSTPTRDWDAVHSLFAKYDFKSITKPETWTKFVATFDPLFGTSAS